MESRSSAGHMDFEWQNASGPLGPANQASPFGKLGATHQQPHSDSLPKKRTFGMLESPSKTSNVPSLRDPASSHNFLFSKPTSPTKSVGPYASIFHSESFTTPRKFDTEYPSSGGETSPENNADNEATPEMGIRSAANKYVKAIAIAEQEGQRPKNDEIKSNLTPRRGELVKRNCYSNKAVKRIQKREQGSVRRSWLQRRRASSDVEWEDAGTKTSKKPRNDERPPAAPGLVASLFGFIETHPNLPHILSYYAQLLLNTFLVLFIIFIIYSFWSTIRADVDKRSEEAMAEVLAEMAVCAKNHLDNGCDSQRRAPALESICTNWERCMTRDPGSVGRARVSAHTFAEIFNSFIEPISFKAMIFCVALAMGCFAVSNVPFGLFRNKMQAQPPPHAYYATPQHAATSQSSSGNWGQYQSPITWEPAPSMMPFQEPNTPSRRLQYR
ncbi:MAG: hypothetical protein M1828_004346 [Chrysothrix sp. TS-e1954]|nr:MAG: hypothetical protein M1828_004346 [Chrysothrix sp. TS-e1954]